MEPIVIAAIATAAGNVIGKVIEYAAGKDDKANADAQKVAVKVYDVLHTNFTDGCVEVLKLMEGGENQLPSQIRDRLYPTFHLEGDAEDHFEREFRYRLEYMRLNGVLTLIGGIEYGISRLGQAFLQEARKRRDYRSVLFDS